MHFFFKKTIRNERKGKMDEKIFFSEHNDFPDSNKFSSYEVNEIEYLD